MSSERFCARAPVRVDPAGGGTDAPPFSVEHGGCVVNMAVSRYAFASAERLRDGEGVILFSQDLDRGEHAATVEDLPASSDLEFLQGFIRRLVRPQDSFLLVTDSDAPAGAGLGGSGALGVAVVAAIERAYGRSPSAVEIAALANDIERADLGYPGGSQDSYGAALGGIHRLEYAKGGGAIPHRIEPSADVLRQLERNSLLIYTGAAHVSGSIHEDIRSAYVKENSSTLEAMFELRKHAEEMAVALESGHLDIYCEKLNASCASLYKLHPSCDSSSHRLLFQELDDCIYGGKTCGAGGGGFVLVYTRPHRRRDCIQKCGESGALVWPLAIDERGVVSWTAPSSSSAEIEALRRRSKSCDGS